MIIEDINFLLSEEGKKLIKKIQIQYPEGRFTAAATLKLKNIYPNLNIRSIIELLTLRKSAKLKFSKADSMFFTRMGLEQSTGERVAEYVAERFSGFKKVADLTSGIGGNTIAIAARTKVLAIDSDRLTLNIAKENAKVYSVYPNVEFMHKNAEDTDLGTCDAVYIDPSRRVKNKRTVSLSDSLPSVEQMLPKILSHIDAVGIKVSPAISYEELEKLPYNPEVEVIADEFECKQIMLWFGILKTTAFRATILPEKYTLETSHPSKHVETSTPKKYIIEPNCAIIRSHLIDEFAQQAGCKKLDPLIAYLTSDNLPVAVGHQYKGYEIISFSRFNLKKLKKTLSEMNISRIDIAKRGLSQKPDEIRKKLKIKEGGNFSLLFMRIGNRHYQAITKKVPQS